MPADDYVQQPAPDPLGSVPAGPQRVCSSPNDDDPQHNPGPLHGIPQRRRLADRTDDRHTFENEEGSREKAKHYTLAHQDRGKEPDKQPPHPSSFSKGCSPPQALKSIWRTVAFTEASVAARRAGLEDVGVSVPGVGVRAGHPARR
jgi:hypothetical protein